MSLPNDLEQLSPYLEPNFEAIYTAVGELALPSCLKPMRCEGGPFTFDAAVVVPLLRYQQGTTIHEGALQQAQDDLATVWVSAARTERVSKVVLWAGTRGDYPASVGVDLTWNTLGGQRQCDGATLSIQLPGRYAHPVQVFAAVPPSPKAVRRRSLELSAAEATPLVAAFAAINEPLAQAAAYRRPQPAAGDGHPTIGMP